MSSKTEQLADLDHMARQTRSSRASEAAIAAAPTPRPPASTPVPSRYLVLAAGVALLLVVGGLTAFVVGSLNRQHLKAVALWLAASRDQGFLTDEFIAGASDRLRLVGMGLGGVGLVFVALSRRLAGVVYRARRETVGALHRLPRKLTSPENRVEFAVLGILMLLFLAAAIVRLDHPLRTDEVGTMRHYIYRPWYYTFLVYRDTNNHIFHSILAHVSCLIFGANPVAFRLPALGATLLLIPATYWAFRVHFDRMVGLVAAAILTVTPYTLGLATNARGYPITLTLTMVMMALCPRIVETRLVWPWPLFVALAVLGLYTVPTMLFSIAIIGVLALLMLGPTLANHWRPIVKRTATCLAAGIVLIFILYAPASVAAMPVAVVDRYSSFGTQPTMWAVLTSLPERMHEMWGFFSYGVPALMAWCVTLGFAVSPLASMLSPRRRVGPLLAFVLGTLAVLLVVKRIPPFWSLTFLWPFYAGFAAVGISWLATGGDRLSRPTRRILSVLIVLTIVAFGLHSLSDTSDGGTQPWYIGYYDAPEAAAFLNEHASHDSALLAQSISPSVLEHYLEYQYGWQTHMLRSSDEHPLDASQLISFPHVYVVQSQLPEAIAFGTTIPGFGPPEVVCQLAHSRIMRFDRRPLGNRASLGQ